jgi:hypothetical protein
MAIFIMFGTFIKAWSRRFGFFKIEKKKLRTPHVNAYVRFRCLTVLVSVKETGARSEAEETVDDVIMTIEYDRLYISPFKICELW